MHSRQDFMTGKVTFHDYYNQYVTPEIKAIVENGIKDYEFKSHVRQTKNPHLNDIPLHKWDRMVPYIPRSTREQLKQAGDWLSLAVGVCILKAAARQIITEKYSLTPKQKSVKVSE